MASKKYLLLSRSLSLLENYLHQISYGQFENSNENELAEIELFLFGELKGLRMKTINKLKAAEIYIEIKAIQEIVLINKFRDISSYIDYVQDLKNSTYYKFKESKNSTRKWEKRKMAHFLNMNIASVRYSNHRLIKIK